MSLPLMQVIPQRAQWLRKYRLMLGKATAPGQTPNPYLTVEDLHINFEVLKTIERTPNTALIKVYNLSPESAARVQKDYDDVILMAGYGSASSQIFRGNIRHPYKYRDKADWITEIDAADGDKDFQQAMICKTLAAGTENIDWLVEIAKEFNQMGGTKVDLKKFRAQLKGAARVRGRTFVGHARDLLDDIARQCDALWSIQDGHLHLDMVDTVLPWQAVQLSTGTGLLESPEVTDKGIAFKCLLNPAIKISGKVWLDNNNMRLMHDKEHITKAGKTKGKIVRLDPDGIYKVFKINIKGDNRGGEWITEGQCIGLDQPIPKQQQPMMTNSSDLMDVQDMQDMAEEAGAGAGAGGAP